MDDGKIGINPGQNAAWEWGRDHQRIINWSLNLSTNLTTKIDQENHNPSNFIW
jgi:hypothetical protein